MSIGISGCLGGGGGRIGSSYTGNLCLDCLGGDLPHKNGMAVGVVSGVEDTICQGAGLGCGSGVVCNFGLVIFLLAPAHSSSFPR